MLHVALNKKGNEGHYSSFARCCDQHPIFDISTEISNITINDSYSVKKRSTPLENYMIKIMLQDIKPRVLIFVIFLRRSRLYIKNKRVGGSQAKKNRVMSFEHPPTALQIKPEWH